MCRVNSIGAAILIILVALLFSNCAEKKFKEAHDQNIKLSSNFSETKDEVSDLSHDLPEMIFECKKASFNLDNVDLSTLAVFLGKIYGQNINSTVGPEYKDVSVNIKVRDICLEPLLDELTNLYNIGYEKTYSAYSIYPPEVRSKIFTLDYHNFYRDGASSISISSTELSSGNSSSSSSSNRNNNYSRIDTKSKESFWDNLERTLSTIVLDGMDPKTKLQTGKDGREVLKGHVAVYRDSGVIVVRSYPRTLKHVEAFLSSITHKATKQVLIEAKILEVTLSDEYKSGIYWEMLKGKFKFSSFYNKEIIGGRSAEDMYDKAQISATDQGMASSVISAKLSNRTDFNSVIQALSIQGKVSVLSSPKIAALNNQRALIKFGDDSYFITNVTTSTISSASSANTNSQQGFKLTPYFSGIALDTTPSIMNNNDIILHIHPMISTVVPETKKITISGLSSEVPAAKVQTRETDTVVKAQSGDIIVIGGLMQSTVGETESGLPSPGGIFTKIFSSFAAKQKTSKKVELVILLRPTISPGWTHHDDDFAKYLSSPPTHESEPSTIQDAPAAEAGSQPAAQSAK